MPIDPRRIEVMDDRTAEVMRRMTPEQKIQAIDELWEFGRALVEGGVRHMHPDWDDNQVRREVVRRMSHGERD